MNRDEILALAVEVTDNLVPIALLTEDEIVAFASRIESLVREECAKIIDDNMWRYTLKASVDKAQLLAAIRKSEG